MTELRQRKLSPHLFAAVVASFLFHVILCLGFAEVRGFDFLSFSERPVMIAMLVEEERPLSDGRGASSAGTAAPPRVTLTEDSSPEQRPETSFAEEDIPPPSETPTDAVDPDGGTHIEDGAEPPEGEDGPAAGPDTALQSRDIGAPDHLVTRSSDHEVPREERLEFDIRWQGLTLGNVSLAHSKQGDESKIRSQIHSSPTLSAFYNVNGDAVSIVRGGLPISFRERHEAGRRRSDKETLFDPSQGKVVVFNHIKGTRAEFTSEDRLWDFVSGLYFIRAQDLDVGRTVSLHVFDSSKFFRVDMNVLRREEVEVGQETLRTLVLRPVIIPYGDKAGKLFEKASDILIWLTDDTAKTPVRIEATTKIGRVVAALKREEGSAAGAGAPRTP